ncbi:MAG: peptide deformylase [Alphaproteobacteria bacterium]|nr:peptide deformylase [Alphaproteobacteria bacterium]
MKNSFKKSLFAIGILFFVTACSVSDQVEDFSIRTYPDRVLFQPCKKIKNKDPNAKHILDQMELKLAETDRGVGLAAPQVGLSQRFVVINLGEGTEHKYRLINPEITWKSPEQSLSREGCLSIPGIDAYVPRHERVKVVYQNDNFEKKMLEASGFLAYCLQHEIDHLDGKLYIDYLSPKDKTLILKKYFKQTKRKNEK